MIHVVFNSRARGGRTRRLRRSIRTALDARAEHRWMETGSIEEGKDVAAAAASGDVVVAIGGDGSIHTVVQGLARSGFRAALGVIPAGTGNDFAFGAGVPRDVEAAVEAVAGGVYRQADVGRAVIGDGDPVWFVNAIGVGFDAAASLRAQRRRFLPGFARYLVAVLETLRTWEAPPTTITADGLLWEDSLMFATFGNGPRSGGGFLVTPGADPFDGRIEMCVARGVRVRRALALLPKVMAGSHVSTPEVTMLKSSAFLLRSERALPVHADGEIVSESCRRIELALLPGALQLAVGPTPPVN